MNTFLDSVDFIRFKDNIENMEPGSEQKVYKVGELSKKFGISVKTLQRWDREGILKAFRSPTGRRYYTEEQLKELIETKPKVQMTLFQKGMIARWQLYQLVRDTLQELLDVEKEAEFCRRLLEETAAVPARYKNGNVTGQSFATDRDLILKQDFISFLCELTKDEPIKEEPGWEDRLTVKGRLMRMIGITTLKI